MQVSTHLLQSRSWWWCRISRQDSSSPLKASSILSACVCVCVCTCTDPFRAQLRPQREALCMCVCYFWRCKLPASGSILEGGARRSFRSPPRGGRSEPRCLNAFLASPVPALQGSALSQFLALITGKRIALSGKARSINHSSYLPGCSEHARRHRDTHTTTHPQ